MKRKQGKKEVKRRMSAGSRAAGSLLTELQAKAYSPALIAQQTQLSLGTLYRLQSHRSLQVTHQTFSRLLQFYCYAQRSYQSGVRDTVSPGETTC